MSARLHVLARRIEREIDALDRAAATVERHWQLAPTAADEDAYLNSVALGLHSWYSGLERIFEAIAIELDGGLPEGDAWHAELVRQMTLDISPTRPSVLNDEVVGQLDEYLRFRHLIRNIYATNLDPRRVGELVRTLPSLWTAVKTQLEAFASFLTALSRESEP